MAALLDSGDRSRPQDGHAPGPPTESRRCDGRLLERHAEAGKTCRSGVWIGKAAEAQPRPDFFRATGSVDAEREFFGRRSEEHTSELQSLMRISYAVFCLKKKKKRSKCTIRHK